MGRASSLDEVPVSRYSYNTLGQRISKESSASNAQESYSWNKLEQLTGVESSEMEIQYEYRADGLLTGKSTNESEQSLLWGRMYDLPVILSDDQYDYVYGEEISPLAQIDKTTGEVEYLHHDQVGSVIAKTDETGNLVNSTSFSSYGEGTPVSAFGYAGGWTDEDTGLIYYRARWYDPEVGKFISIDPLLEITQDPYGYASNSPLEFTDPTGMIVLLGSGRNGSSNSDNPTNAINETTIRTAVYWYFDTSTADKLDDASALLSAASLALVFTPAAPLAIVTALGATGLSIAASREHASDGNPIGAILSGFSAVPGVGSVGARGISYGIKKISTARVRNPARPLNAFRIKMDVLSDFGGSPASFYTRSPSIICGIIRDLR